VVLGMCVQGLAFVLHFLITPVKADAPTPSVSIMRVILSSAALLLMTEACVT
jgi:hypothetical protein